ncbi:MAG: NAD(P)/FAD-dependent oxidoreductase [Longimicrobiaceae bacterium]
MSTRVEVVVIGGGQAGLAMGHHLMRQGTEFLILDAAPRPGDAWRTRWDSLTLFTPARYSALPEMPFPGEPESYPTKDAVADYLEAYAARFDLPVRSGRRAASLRQTGDGFVIEAGGDRYEAGQVVVATGPFQAPFVPEIASGLAPEVVQLHSAEYRNPAQLPPGDVLVVGGGNSGVQIAEELSRTHRVHLSVGERLPRLPERLLGRSIFGWLDAAGLLDVTVDSRLGRRMSRTETLIGKSPGMLRRSHGVELAGRAVAARGDRVTMAGGTSTRVEGVVWATGFRAEYGWIQAPVLGARGAPVQRRGVMQVPGLYFLGLPWMHTRGSALIGWVGRDAAYLADRIAAHRPRPAPNAGALA